MASILGALGSSVEHLRSVVGLLGGAQLDEPAYPTEWTIADVLSHIGSGAVIMQRRLDDSVEGNATPDDFAPGVWDSWNAKSARAKADDALLVDRGLLERIESLSDEARSSLRFSMGPLELLFDGFVGMRLNEHALHTWDIEVAIDPAATLPADSVVHIVDNLELIARFTAKSTGSTRAIAVRTDQPRRDFSIELSSDAVTLGARDHSGQPDLELPAEAFVRLIYGRLDPAHTPGTVRESPALEVLREVFPGP
ncbi:MAG: maleylpyruvate isomerase family mycothiol-dependent enzyme [Acidimicrobiales bacterium]